MLVLDDYHVVHAPEIHEAMAFLLDHLPPQLQLVVGDPRPTRRCRWPGCGPAAS